MAKLLIAIAAVLGFGVFIYLNPQVFNLQTKNSNLPTYFTYTQEETKALKSLTSQKTMNPNDLYDIDKKIEAVSAPGKYGPMIGKTFISMIDPYISVAQRDAVFLSYNAHQKFMGSLEPVTLGVVCIFEPEECKKIKNEGADDYSQKLSEIVLIKVKARFDKASKDVTKYQPKQGIQYWQGSKPEKPFKSYTAVNITWLLSSPFNFLGPKRPFEYDSAEEKKLIAGIADQIKITDEQKKVIEEIEVLRTTPGLLDIFPVRVTEEMKSRGYNLAQIVWVNSVLQMAQWDAMTVVDHTKYDYLLKRPYQRLAEIDPKSPTIKLLEVSSDPTYPSYTGAMAKVDEVVLSYLFPNRKDEWAKLAYNLTYKDVWTGDHFPIDMDLTFQMAEKIGNDVVRQLKASGGVPEVK